MSSDKYAYLSLERLDASATRLQELGTVRQGQPIHHRSLIARLSTASAATKDDELKLWSDLDHIHAFDPVDGRKPRPLI